jgi:tetratricopeptide (TPR) repeat protein
LFYEHVHPTFNGNYLLARTLAEQVEPLLPEDLAARSRMLTTWPSLGDCARRLAWTDWARQAVLQDILARVNEPPFTAQVNHEAQLKTLTAVLEGLSPALLPVGQAQARSACETALAMAPDDPVLLGLLSFLEQASGDLDGAATLARRRVEVLPSSGQAWQQYGLILVRQNKATEAVSAFGRATELDPMDVLHRHNLAQSLWLLGRHDEAITQYRHALKAQPNFAIGWLSLGQILEQTAHATEAAESYQKALSCRSSRATDLATLARFCRSRGWQAGAMSNYDQAITVNPGDAKLRVEAGEFLLTQGRFGDAEQRFKEAVDLAPDLVQGRQLYGTMLGQAGKASEAEQQFREVLRLAPDHVEGRLNLGISLMTQGRNDEAVQNFEYVLQQSPTNGLALKYLQRLRATPPP